MVLLAAVAFARTTTQSRDWTSCWACRPAGVPAIVVVTNNYRAGCSQHQKGTDVGQGWRASAAATSAGKGTPMHRRESPMTQAGFVYTTMGTELAWTDSQATAFHDRDRGWGHGHVVGWEGRAACLRRHSAADGSSWAIGMGRRGVDIRGVARLGMRGWNGCNP